MESPAISIIVPIYNMERYLKECLDSIQSQTFSDWECLLVDDGSTDSTPEICRHYSSLDCRFRYIRKQNGGVSSARNAGLRNAKGEYIGFVDPDDWVEPELFQRLYDLAVKYDADISQVGFWREYKSRRTLKQYVEKTTVIDGKTALKEISYDRLQNYLWNRLHRSTIINCEFPEGRVFEDVFAYGRWLKNVERMVIDPTPLYHYRMRKGSIVHEARHRTDYFKSCIDKMVMLRDSQSGDVDQAMQSAYINKSAVEAAKRIARIPDFPESGKEALYFIHHKVCEFPLPPVRYMGLKKWWRARMLRSNPDRFASIMRGVHMLDLWSKHDEKQLFE